MKLTETMIASVQERLQDRWSPEQIFGRFFREQGISLSPETVYRLVLKGKQQAGHLCRYLRHQAKSYCKRYCGEDYRGKIPGRVDISERPVIVGTRARVGDWETDLVIGQGHKGALVTLAERRSRFYLVLPILCNNH